MPGDARHAKAPRYLRAAARGELVAVITDNPELQRLLADALASQGLRAIEANAQTVGGAIERLGAVLVLLDLDRGDGHRLLERLRSSDAITPIFALSRRASEGDKVLALDGGADDYITKPVATSELLARVRVILRHRNSVHVDDAIDVGPIRIDRARHRVTVSDVEVHLTPLEFKLLSVLAEHVDRVVTREQLLRLVWGNGSSSAHHLRVHIAAIRQKIEPRPAEPRHLVTVVGVGYRLCTS
ncbi:MAG: winged helix-turn-helix domain-containing protein [Kofleriaceae bacterium]